MDRPAAGDYAPHMETIEIDARGLLCPLPVLKLAKRMKSLAAGGQARLLADDPAAVVDVPHYCAESGNELVEISDQNEGHTYLVRKSA